MGPNSREILAKVTSRDLSNDHFAFATLQTIGIAGCPVTALRITYVGEIGWELHLPVEYALTVYETLMQAGAESGLINAGYRVIETCRLEKGYRAWGSDIGPDHTPLEAGLGWAVKSAKTDIPFKGREALTAQKNTVLKKRLAGFKVADASVVLHGRETIYRNGKRVGWLSSGGYGHHLGVSIGYGYIRNADGVSTDYINSGDYQLEVATELVDCEVALKPFYDPDMKKVRG